MTDAHDKHERRSSTAVVVLCMVIVLPVAYVLSYGPASWLVQHSYMSIRAFMFIYWPIAWSCNQSEALGAAIDWYELLWVDGPTRGLL